ncbi:MAG TPA: ferritin-like domain-containing protein, partial [Polyangiales bacterium]
AEWSSWRSVPEGFEVYATRLTSDCAPIQTTRFHLRVTPSGEIRVLGSSVVQESGGCAGRKPAGLRSGSVALGKSALGDYLARIAHLEAASVVAFERLARELRAHGAPLGLLRGAIEARGDEVRHAEQLGQLALARGGQLSALDVKDLPVRELEEIALENTVEGCVRETFGALVGAYQAQHAQDAELRRAMVAVAADEARHAALSHRVQHWLEPRLSAEARERVRHARERAVFELAHEIATGESDELRREAGLPSPEMSHILLEELTKTLWSSPFNPRGHIALGSNS